MSEKVKKNLRISQAQFREKLRKLRLRQNYSFLIKKTCMRLQLHFVKGSCVVGMEMYAEDNLSFNPLYLASKTVTTCKSQSDVLETVIDIVPRLN